MFTLHEAECLADCDKTPCVQVNHRYMGAQTPASFDALVDDLRGGRLDRHDTVPSHGTLVRVRRTVGPQADRAPSRPSAPSVAQEQAARAAAATAAGAGEKA